MKTEDIDQLTTELRDLKIRVAQLEAAITDRETDERSASTAAAAVFQRGDRVKVKNKLKKPATWPVTAKWDQEAAQLATVTHNYKNQVHFITDNGVKTWRAHNNLARLAK
jgi:outer membrane murein-binding lipoprotein Lpp